MKKRQNSGSRAGFWTTLTAINIVAIGYVLGVYLHADSSDVQLFAAMALIFVTFFVLIGDIISIMLVCEVWSDQRR